MSSIVPAKVCPRGLGGAISNRPEYCRGAVGEATIVVVADSLPLPVRKRSFAAIPQADLQRRFEREKADWKRRTIDDAFMAGRAQGVADNYVEPMRDKYSGNRDGIVEVDRNAV